jgi:hypothetical protein
MKRSTLPFVCGRSGRVLRTAIPRSSQPSPQRRLKQVPLSVRTLEPDPVLAVEALAGLEEGQRRGGRLARVEAGEAEPARVVDGGEEVEPAGLALGPLGAVAGDAMAGADDPAELLDVDVQQLARALALVADHLARRQGRPQPRAAVPAQDCVHGRGGEAERPAERVRAEAQLAAGAQDRLLDRRWRPPRRAARARGAIVEPLAAARPADPLRGRLPRAADHQRGSGDRRACASERDEPLSLAAAESGISMKNHRALLWLRLRQAAP